MKLHVLLSAFTLFFLCLGIHVLLWRWKRPLHQASTLLIIFLIPLFAFCALCFFLPEKVSRFDLAAIGLLHIALASAYLQTYPAIQAMSPTLVILLLIQKEMPLGLTQREISNAFDRKRLLEDRIQDLLDAGLIRESNGQFEITAVGLTLIKPLVILRKILGLTPGQG